MSFEIIPAIDLRGGSVVRLRQGDYAQQTSYRVEPLVLAHEYAAGGATWLHVVDLDGARSGNFDNLRLIEAIAGGLMNVQAGGGVRGQDDIERLLDAGVSRVVIGSLAIREPDLVCGWLAHYGSERLCIALDARDDQGVWRLPSSGWTQAETATLDVLAPRYAAAGVKHLLSTDIACDGMLSGPNLQLYEFLHKLIPGVQVQASGGVRGTEDIRALRRLGAGGVVLGRSLLEGTLSLAEALAC